MIRAELISKASKAPQQIPEAEFRDRKFTMPTRKRAGIFYFCTPRYPLKK
jgi:hypothetical protein